MVQAQNSQQAAEDLPVKIKKGKQDGLEYFFDITIPANVIDEKVNDELRRAAQTMKVPGFRPGHAPLSLLQKRYGEAVARDILQDLSAKAVQKALTDNHLRAANQPHVHSKGDYEAGKDYEFEFHIETLPAVDIPDVSKIKVTRQKADVSDKEIQETMERLASQNSTTEPVKEARAAKKGDTLLIDFEGKVDDVPFPGGKGEKVELELGSGQFIPGFEDQLIGKKVGDQVDVKVTFPAEYHAADLAGKDAVFDVEVKELRKKVEAKVNDDLAKVVGFENLADLQDFVKERLQGEFDEASRTKVKRQLFDELEKMLDFPLPNSLMKQEVEGINQQIKHSQEMGVEDDSLDEDEKSIQKLAERRVRLGLFLAEVGQRNAVEVTQEELNQGLMREMQNYPGYEKQMMEMYQKHPRLVENIRAPIFEDKVVDLLLEQVKVEDVIVDRDELLSDEEDGKSDKKSTAKKAAKKSTTSKSADKPAAKKDSKPASKTKAKSGSKSDK